MSDTTTGRKVMLLEWKRCFAVIAASMLLLGGGSAQALPIDGPDYPPPGGVTDCNTGCVTTNIDTRFTLTLSGGASFINASDLLLIDATFDDSISVVNVVTGDFTANLLFEADFGGFQAVDDLFDAEATQIGHSTVKNIGLGFYTTVPEPNTALLLAFGLTGPATPSAKSGEHLDAHARRTAGLDVGRGARVAVPESGALRSTQSPRQRAAPMSVLGWR
jgi:hypothetical protein